MKKVIDNDYHFQKESLEMDKVDVVEGMIGSYLGTFAMLGFLGLWDFLFDVRMNEVSMLMGLLVATSSAICGISLGMGLAYVLRRFT